MSNSAAVRSIAILLLFTASAFCQQNPVEWSIKLNHPAKALQPGNKVNVELTAAIEPGWHIYSITQAPGGPYPTRITMPVGQPFKLAGTILGPEPEMKFDEGFGIMTEIHHRAAKFILPVQVGANAAGGPTKLQVDVRFVVCDARRCLPPKTMHVSVPITIAAKTKSPSKSVAPKSPE
jgi:DsbC/DsbD-like thiol-disulfide interchange protein